MVGRSRLSYIAIAIGICIIGAVPKSVPGADEDTAKTIRIGMAGSMFRDMPEETIQSSSKPFQELMKAETGLSGEVINGGDALALAKALNSDQVRLGVFHGFEFAWAQAKYPKLRPLLIVVNQRNIVFAHVLVNQKSKTKDLAALKEKSLAIPEGTRAHCWLFLERACSHDGKNIKSYFSKVVAPKNMEDALDDVVDGETEAVLVDNVSLERYKGRKPARFAKLKEILKSPAFPATVVAYREGGLDEATLARFRKGMLHADKTAYGRQLLTLWRLTGFEKLPKDYSESLKAIAKKYPPGK